MHLIERLFNFLGSIYVFVCIVLSISIMLVDYNLMLTDGSIYDRFSSKTQFILPSFLTIGTFLLTFINLFLFTLKEKIFDSETYKKKYEISGKGNHIYSPLVNTTKIFMLTIKSCFFTVFLTLISFAIDYRFIAYLILSCAILNILLLFFVVFLISDYIGEYFELLIVEKSKNQ